MLTVSEYGISYNLFYNCENNILKLKQIVREMLKQVLLKLKQMFGREK